VVRAVVRAAAAMEERVRVAPCCISVEA